MKKILLSAAIITMLGLGASAQRGSDGFFSYNEFGGDRGDLPASSGLVMPTQPIGYTQNESAPLGTGLLIMTALGAGYAVVRKKK